MALLKGLLSAETSTRLSAKAALELPAFDFLRTAEEASNPKQLSEVQEETDLVDDDDDMHQSPQSIKSLEKRSIYMKKPSESQSDANSIREGTEGEGFMNKNMNPDLYKKSLLKRMASNNPGSPQKQEITGGHARQESIGSLLSQGSGDEVFKSNGLPSPSNPHKKFNLSVDNQKPGNAGSSSTKQISLFATKYLSKSGQGDFLTK